MNNNFDKIIFISKPRCASTSIYNTVYDWDDNKDGPKRYYHLPAKTIKEQLGNEKWNNIFSFAVKRNPYDLIKSWYYHHKNKPSISNEIKNFYPDTIEEWIQEKDFITHWQKYNGWNKNPLFQKQWICDENDNIIVDFLLEFNNLEKDFDYIQNKFNLNKKLSFENKSIQDNYKLNNETKEIIYNKFKEDFEIFGYNK